MRKNLIFSFVFFAIILLSLSVVNAGLWITGDTISREGSKETPTAIASSDGAIATSTRTSATETPSLSEGTTRTALPFSRSSSLRSARTPASLGSAWVATTTTLGDVCYVRKTGTTGRLSLFSRR